MKRVKCTTSDNISRWYIFRETDPISRHCIASGICIYYMFYIYTSTWRMLKAQGPSLVAKAAHTPVHYNSPGYSIASLAFVRCHWSCLTAEYATGRTSKWQLTGSSEKAFGVYRVAWPTDQRGYLFNSRASRGAVQPRVISSISETYFASWIIIAPGKSEPD